MSDNEPQAAAQMKSERLMSEQEAIEFLGLQGRGNPSGSLRWLMRSRKLSYVRLAKGIYGFKQSDLDAFVDMNRVAADERWKGTFNKAN